MNKSFILTFLIVAIALYISLFRLGSVPLFDVDEAVFSEATKEMIKSGDWITPTYNGENRYDKPILFYWLMSISYKIFGINEFSSRFPSAIASFVLIISFFYFMKRLLDEKMGFYSTISLTLSIYFLVYSHAAITDMTLTLFITLSLFSFYLWTQENKKNTSRKNIYHYGFYLFSALAFLTKGLIGIVFPFVIATIYMTLIEGWKGIKKIISLKGLILFLIIALPWYIAQLTINGQEFFTQFFIKHHLRRYTGVISGHRGPFFYYIIMLLIGIFPWIAFLPAGIKNTIKDKDRLKIFALIWFSFIFIFFSISVTKLPNYILPAMPAISILIVSGMMVQDNRWQYISHLLLIIISIILGTSLVVAKVYFKKLGILNVDWILLLSIIPFAIGFISLYTIITKKQQYLIVSGLMIIFLSLLLIKALPVASQYLQGPIYKYSLYAKKRLQDNSRLIVFALNNPSIIFYSDHMALIFRNKKDLEDYIIKDKRHTLIITKSKYVEFFKNIGFNVLSKDSRYAILEKGQYERKVI